MRHRNRNRVGPSAQRGQALAEMAIAAAVIVPLFLLVPTLGKYFHMKQTAQQAARSAAWSGTVTQDYEWGPSPRRLDPVRERNLALDRHFGRAQDEIRTQPSNAGANTDVRNEMMNSFSNRHLVRRSDVTLTLDNGTAGRFMQVFNGLGFLRLAPGDFPPSTQGFITSRVTLRPRNLQTSNGGQARFLDPFHNINLEMTAQHAVLADGWNAAGSGLDESVSNGRRRSVHNQVKTLSPLGALEPLSDVMENLGPLDMLPVLGTVSRLRPGYIQPDIVPKDKLEAYRPR